jgi:hypothetical protein
MRHLITVGFVIATILTYYFGLKSGAGLLFVVGAVFEIISAKRLGKRSES